MGVLFWSGTGCVTFKMTILVLLFATAALAQVDDFSCPDEFEGYYPHLYSCDKYWACQDGIAELRTCGNGLAFIELRSTRLSNVRSFIWLNVERELSLKNQFQPQIVPDSGEHLLILRTVGSSGNVRMERQTDMNVPQG